MKAIHSGSISQSASSCGEHDAQNQNRHSVGRSRRGSINVLLAKALVKRAPDTLEFIWVRMDDMPFYNLDLEPDRPPPEISRFTEALKSCDAVLAVTPEYNR